jgi:hypothetical protein
MPTARTDAGKARGHYDQAYRVHLTTRLLLQRQQHEAGSAAPPR